MPHATNSSNPLLKQLWAFERVHLSPGESKTVSLGLSAAQLATANAAGEVISAAAAGIALEITDGVDTHLAFTARVTGSPTRILESYDSA